MRQKVHCLNNVCIYISIYTWTVKWQTSYLCDLQHDVSETRPFPANTEFKLKAIFLYRSFPVKLRLLHQGVTARGLALYYEARWYKVELTGKSVKCRNALLWIAWYSFSKKTQFQSVYGCLSVYRHTTFTTAVFTNCLCWNSNCLSQEHVSILCNTYIYIYIYISMITETST